MAEDANPSTEAEQIIAEQAELIAKLSAENTALKAAPEAVPTFSHGEHTYAVGMAEFIYNSVKYTAQHLLENEALQAELIEKGAGYISRLNHELTDAK